MGIYQSHKSVYQSHIETAQGWLSRVGPVIIENARNVVAAPFQFTHFETVALFKFTLVTRRDTTPARRKRKCESRVGTEKSGEARQDSLRSRFLGFGFVPPPSEASQNTQNRDYRPPSVHADDRRRRSRTAASHGVHQYRTQPKRKC